MSMACISNFVCFEKGDIANLAIKTFSKLPFQRSGVAVQYAFINTEWEMQGTSHIEIEFYEIISPCLLNGCKV